MVKFLPCVASCVLALMVASPAARAASPAEPAQAASSFAPTPAARVKPQRRRSTSRPRVAARSVAARLKSARASLKRAQAEVAAAATRESDLRASLARARQTVWALDLVILFLTTTLLWSLWRGRTARLNTAQLTEELRQANHALTQMDQIQDRLSRARRENDELVRQRQNQDMAVAASAADVAKLPDTARSRAVASAKMQLGTLESAAATGGPVVTPMPLVNGEEHKVLKITRAWAQTHDLLVFTQVGMGGFLREEDGQNGQVLATFNSKRSDFVVCDEDGEALFVIEHHGGNERYRTGHFQGDWAERDRVKRRLLNLAQLGLVVTRSGWTEKQIHPLLEQAFNVPAAAVPIWPEPGRKPWSARGASGSNIAASKGDG